MNETPGPNGVVPSTLVFGEHPPVFTRSENPKRRPTLDERAKIAFKARNEMEQHMGKLRIDRALRHAVPPAADVTYERNDKVLVWREKQVNNRIGEWVGPYPVDDWDPDKKLVFVRDTPVGPSRPFNLVQVKKYHRPEFTAHTFLFDLTDGLRNMSHASDTRMT